MVFCEIWIKEVLQEFLLSGQFKENFEIQSIQTIYGHQLMCIKLRSPRFDQEQSRLLEIVIKNIIKENACPLSMIKHELETILNHNKQLKIYLKPILVKLISKYKNFEEEICLMTGDIVRLLRKMEFLDNWKDSNSDEIYFALKPPSNDQQTVMLSAYLQHVNHAEYKTNNNSLKSDVLTCKQDLVGRRLRCFST